MEPLSRFVCFFLNGSVGLFRGLNSKLKPYNPAKMAKWP